MNKEVDISVSRDSRVKDEFGSHENSARKSCWQA